MYSSVNTIWVLFGTALVFFMQAGFSLCEAGFTRAKNTGNILMKNLMDFCIGTPAFWLVGFGLMFGKGSGIIGMIHSCWQIVIIHQTGSCNGISGNVQQNIARMDFNIG